MTTCSDEMFRGLDGWHAGPLFVVSKRRGAKVRLSRGARRYRFLRSRTPAWADRDLIRSIKRLAVIWTQATGVQHSVDHEVPLQHELVCGLHVGANLAVTTLAANIEKGNRFSVEEQMELFV